MALRAADRASARARVPSPAPAHPSAGRLGPYGIATTAWTAQRVDGWPGGFRISDDQNACHTPGSAYFHLSTGPSSGTLERARDRAARSRSLAPKLGDLRWHSTQRRM